MKHSSLFIEDRRKKLTELKAKTECRDCGRRGHWKGDNQCTMKKTAHVATALSSYAGEVATASSSPTGQLTRSVATVTSGAFDITDESPDSVFVSHLTAFVFTRSNTVKKKNTAAAKKRGSRIKITESQKQKMKATRKLIHTHYRNAFKKRRDFFMLEMRDLFQQFDRDDVFLTKKRNGRSPRWKRHVLRHVSSKRWKRNALEGKL